VGRIRKGRRALNPDSGFWIQDSGRYFGAFTKMLFDRIQTMSLRIASTR
jgi:hypothetical protein